MVTAADIAIVKLAETASTNDWLKEHREISRNTLFKVATAEFQTSGKGQQGNSWESEPRANLLFSILSHPHFIESGAQFCLSEAISLAIVGTLSKLDGKLERDLSIKWPNDIYWKDLKLAGILIENAIQGRCLADSIIGVGLNVNQSRFISNAPNPVSIRNIIDMESDLDAILKDILSGFAEYYLELSEGRSEEVHSAYLRHLFRRDGLHAYKDSHGRFLASIETVRPNGILLLRDSDGNLRNYEFKQVSYII